MRIGIVFAAILSACCLLGSGLVRADDWPQWGGRCERNMVSPERGLPDSFEPGRRTPNSDGIDMATTENVKWVASVGTNAYGNPTIADGRVFLGTDDASLTRDDRIERSRAGLVQCLDEATGELLWRLPTPRRTPPKDAHYGFQHLGVCSSPTVDGDRVYVVDCGDRVLCLDVNGQADGNDGPFQDEAAYMSGKDGASFELRPQDGDIVWVCDLIDEVGVIPHDAASNSVIVHGDHIYLSTSNGVDEPHENVLRPDAPAIVVLDKHTGRVVAREEIGLSSRLFHCQWCSPSIGEVNGRSLVFVGGGDGVCYAFETLDETPEAPVALKLVWSYDCLPDAYKYRDGKPIPYYEGDKRKKYSTNDNDGRFVGPSQIISTPVFHEGRVYVPVGQDPAHGRGRGILHCIDATKEGDVTRSGRVWAYDGLDRSMATVAVANGLVYAADVAGRVHCLDAESGKVRWVHDSDSETWGGVLVADGKLFFGNKRAFYVFAEGDREQLLSTIRLGTPAYSTPVAANGVLYVMTGKYLWAVGK